MMTLVTLACDHCGKAFDREAWIVAKNAKRGSIGAFCSRSCRSAHRMQPDAWATPEDFWSKVRRGAPNACWTWTGALDANGYGKVRRRGRTVGAHRVAYELTNGPIPAGQHVLHHCDNPPCVRPNHLFLGTSADNARDRESKGRGRWPRKSA